MEWLLILFVVFLHNECEPVVDLSIACNGVSFFSSYFLFLLFGMEYWTINIGIVVTHRIHIIYVVSSPPYC